MLDKNGIAKRIAKEAVDAMFMGKAICIPTKTWKIITFLIKIVPNSFFNILSRIIAPGRYDEKYRFLKKLNK